METTCVKILLLVVQTLHGYLGDVKFIKPELVTIIGRNASQVKAYAHNLREPETHHQETEYLRSFSDHQCWS